KNWSQFSPDDSNIVYTATDQHFVWDSWQVSPFGGKAKPFLPNASGLSFMSDGSVVSSNRDFMRKGQLLYSKVLSGVHMAIAAGSQNRTDEKLVYVPKEHGGMAHRGVLSPDGYSMLIVE